MIAWLIGLTMGGGDKRLKTTIKGRIFTTFTIKGRLE